MGAINCMKQIAFWFVLDRSSFELSIYLEPSVLILFAKMLLFHTKYLLITYSPFIKHDEKFWKDWDYYVSGSKFKVK